MSDVLEPELCLAANRGVAECQILLLTAVCLGKCAEGKVYYTSDRHAKTQSGLPICEAPHKLAPQLYTLLEHVVKNVEWKVNRSYPAHFALHFPKMRCILQHSI